MSLFDRLHTLVPPELPPLSGSLFHTGRKAFEQSSTVYILGLNPGGDFNDPDHVSLTDSIAVALARPEKNWSSYRDDLYGKRKTAGKSKMQRRVLHLLTGLNLDIGSVPMSNAIYARSVGEKGLGKDTDRLLALCWPVHAAVIHALQVRVIICFGKTPANWVKEQLKANTLLQEGPLHLNHWKQSVRYHAHGNTVRQVVITLSHPSWDDWEKPPSDQVQFIRPFL